MNRGRNGEERRRKGRREAGMENKKLLPIYGALWSLLSTMLRVGCYHSFRHHNIPSPISETQFG